LSKMWFIADGVIESIVADVIRYQKRCC
jgi:hypothetical protein